jgi:hypothetical protein
MWFRKIISIIEQKKNTRQHTNCQAFDMAHHQLLMEIKRTINVRQHHTSYNTIFRPTNPIDLPIVFTARKHDYQETRKQYGQNLFRNCLGFIIQYMTQNCKIRDI